MKNVIELTESDFEREVLNAAGPIVVDFYAPWCGPCKMFAPLLEEFASKFSGTLKFTKLNVDDAPQLAGRYGITSVPTLMLFDAGREVERAAGLNSLIKLQTWIKRTVAAAPQTSGV